VYQRKGIKSSEYGSFNLTFYQCRLELTTPFITKGPGVDVVNVDDCRLAQFADNTWIIPITDYIRRDKAEVKTDWEYPSTQTRRKLRGYSLSGLLVQKCKRKWPSQSSSVSTIFQGNLSSTTRKFVNIIHGWMCSCIWRNIPMERNVGGVYILDR